MNYNTKFKNELINLFENRNISKTSIDMYIKNLERLNNDEPLKNLSFLLEKDIIIEKLKNYKPNTFRNYIISIVSTLKNFDDIPKFKKLYSYYYDILNTTNKTLKDKEKEREKTTQQNDNWISWDDVIKKYNQLKDLVNKFKNNKEINIHNYDLLLEFIIISLYCLSPPKRNQDYAYMNIINKYNENMPITNNYLDYINKKFIFNKYKTAKSHGVITEDINDELFNNLNIYIKFHPLLKKKINKNTNTHLLVYKDGTPLHSVNSITRILNKIFDKKIGSSMLRHIYTTEKYSHIIDQMEHDAELMGHNINTQINNYIKKENTNNDDI